VSKIEDRPPPVYFMEREGLVFAGLHLLIDLWEAERLNDLALMRSVFTDCVAASGATLRSLDLFQFADSGGIAGIAMLTQSHISVHSWPEHSYGAFDVFVCGKALPYPILPVLDRAFRPKQIQVTEHKRGLRFRPEGV
jgi:S-adenosylmethionine decarboxylase